MNMEKKIKVYALENASRFKGKANPGAVVGKILNEYPEWKQKMGELMPKVKAVLAEVHAMTVPEQVAMLQELAPELLIPKEKKVRADLKELAKAMEGKVVMRFAPSPSGTLHIGHAHGAGLNAAYCHKYKGKLILRLEDTNPDGIEPKAYDGIVEDMTWLYGKEPFIVIQSDRVESYYSVLLKLLEEGNAYVCSCDVEEFRELVKIKSPCPCRSIGVNENVERWHKMHDNEGYVDGDVVVRIKTDINHKNPALRDFPVARINTNEHPRVGFKYRVWPLMNLSVAVDDHELGLTHVLRGKDHYDNTKRQMYIYDYMGWSPPEFMHTGRINFDGLILSSSAFRKDIDNGVYSGWDDHRLPTLASMRRRGYQAEAFIKFAKSLGVTSVDKRVAKDEFFKSLDSFNRVIIEPIAMRYFAVIEPKEIEIPDAPNQDIELDLHPDHKHGGRLMHSGQKFLIDSADAVNFESGKLYRLMDSLNFVYESGECKFDSTDLEIYRQKKGKILHWLPAEEKLVDVSIHMPDGTVQNGKGEIALEDLEEGTIVQFERKGFVRLDRRDNGSLVFLWLHR